MSPKQWKILYQSHHQLRFIVSLKINSKRLKDTRKLGTLWARKCETKMFSLIFKLLLNVTHHLLGHLITMIGSPMSTIMIHNVDESISPTGLVIRYHQWSTLGQLQCWQKNLSLGHLIVYLKTLTCIESWIMQYWMNHFWAKFKHWIESDRVSKTPRKHWQWGP